MHDMRKQCRASHLKDSGQLRVPVGDVLAAGALRQRADHVAQRQQALVDGHALRKLLPGRARLLRALTPWTASPCSAVASARRDPIASRSPCASRL